MQNVKVLAAVAVAVVFLFVGSFAWAQTGAALKEKGIEKVEAMDTDKDGKISLDEYKANCEKRFKAMDTNHDGYLTKDEMQQKAAEVKEKAKGKWMEKKGQQQ